MVMIHLSATSLILFPIKALGWVLPPYLKHLLLGRPPSFCREPLVVPTFHTQFWRSPRKEEPPGVDGGNSLHLSPLRLIFTIRFCAKKTKCPSPVESLSSITCAGPVSVCWARNTEYSEDRTKRSTPGIELRVGTDSLPRRAERRLCFARWEHLGQEQEHLHSCCCANCQMK